METSTGEDLEQPLMPREQASAQAAAAADQVRRRPNRQQHQGQEGLSGAPPPPPPYSHSVRSTDPREDEALQGQGEEGEGSDRTGEEGSVRILDRDDGFFQSRGIWGIQRLSRGHYHLLQSRRRRRCCRPRFLWKVWHEWIKGDWFHRLAYQRTFLLLFILFVIYVAIVVFFAFIYLAVSILGQKNSINPDGTTKVIAFCDMDINDHMEALYFSLSTMTTIGYGVSDYYFGGCWTPLLLVLWQVCTAVSFDAVAVGLIFHRISRGSTRGRTIIFSSKAVVRCVRGVPYLMFRLGELRRYHLIEANVRVYCVKHERYPASDTAACGAASNDTPIEIETTHFVARQVKLTHPDEEYGSHILMSLPQVAVHRMDESSPLVPSESVWYDRNGIAHVRHENTPVEDQVEELKIFLADREAEIIVLVEGTDEGTGTATQARHSYTSSDLAWNFAFAPCVLPYVRQNQTSLPFRTRRDADPACTIDFSKFHDIQPVSPSNNRCPYVPKLA